MTDYKMQYKVTVNITSDIASDSGCFYEIELNDSSDFSHLDKAHINILNKAVQCIEKKIAELCDKYNDAKNLKQDLDF